MGGSTEDSQLGELLVRPRGKVVAEVGILDFGATEHFLASELLPDVLPRGPAPCGPRGATELPGVLPPARRRPLPAGMVPAGPGPESAGLVGQGGLLATNLATWACPTAKIRPAQDASGAWALSHKGEPPFHQPGPMGGRRAKPLELAPVAGHHGLTPATCLTPKWRDLLPNVRNL